MIGHGYCNRKYWAGGVEPARYTDGLSAIQSTD
jgi:hypothetical protein